jgi:hypothetical protein
MVEAATMTRALDEHELQRRVDDGKVGVARPELGRLGPEQLAVELDCRLHIIHVESELDTGHDAPPDTFVAIDAYILSDASTIVNRRRW